MKFLKTTTFRKAPSLALAGALAGLLAPLAHAQQTQQVTAAAQGDVILAFRAAAQQNLSTGSYLVNVGPVADLLSTAPGSTTELQIVDLGDDLDAYDTFVNDEAVPWHSRSQVVWSAFSRDAPNNQAIYISRARPSLAQQSAPWHTLDFSQHGIAHTEISSVIGQGFNVLTSTVGFEGSANNPRGGFQTTLTANSPTYVFQVDPLLIEAPARQDFRTWSSIEQSFGGGAEAALLDFYVHTKGSVLGRGTIDYIGYFSIDTDGAVSFTRAGTVVDPGDIDSDGDGFSDEDEDLAGTDRNDPSSFPKLAAPVVVPGESVVLSFPFPHVEGNTYTIQYTPDFVEPWEDIGVALPVNGANLEFIDTDEDRINEPKGFYRLVISNP